MHTLAHISTHMSQSPYVCVVHEYFKSASPHLLLSTISAQQRPPLCLYPVAVRAGPRYINHRCCEFLPIPIPMHTCKGGPLSRPGWVPLNPPETTLHACAFPRPRIGATAMGPGEDCLPCEFVLQLADRNVRPPSAHYALEPLALGMPW